MSRGLSSVYDRMRRPEAGEAARGGAGASGLQALRGSKYCLLVTYRRSGEPVPTPVWFGLDGPSRLYVRTDPASAKVRRLRNDARVLVGPSDVRGKPLGPLAAATGRVLEPDEHEHAEAVLRSSYGLGRRIYEAVLGRAATTYLEVTAT